MVLPDTLASQLLEEVTVAVRRPDAIIMPDKVSYSPDATVAGSGGTVFDVMSSLPGISIDSSGSISVNGIKGVAVEVDGRKCILTGEMLLTYLKSLPATSVARVEVVTAPSAKDEGASPLTVINLKMSKRRDQGFSVGINGSGRVWKAKRGLGSLTASYAAPKVSVSATYTFISASNPTDLFTVRPKLVSDVILRQKYRRDRIDRIHNASASCDYYPNKSVTIGADVTMNCFARDETGVMRTSASGSGTEEVTSNLTDTRMTNLFGSAFMKKSFAEASGEVDATFDFFSYSNDETQTIRTSADEDVDGRMYGRVRGYILSADYRQTLSGRWRVSAGVRSSLLHIRNRGIYEGEVSSGIAGIDGMSSLFRYRENVNAVYAEGVWSAGRVSVSGGLRMEQTNERSEFPAPDGSGERSVDRRHGIDLFENLLVKYVGADGDGLTAGYARRIARPRFADLNPFVYIMDDITQSGGNTHLRPGVSDNIRLAYTKGGWLSVALAGSVNNGEIVRCYREISPGIVFVSPENLPRGLHCSLTVSAVNIRVRSWWTMSVTAAMLYDNYRFPSSLVLPGNCRLTPMADVRNHLIFPAGWALEISARRLGKLAYGQALVAPTGYTYVGVRKKVLNDRGSVSFFVRDLFNHGARKSEICLNGYVGSLSEREYESMRLIGMSFSLRVDSGKMKSRKRGERGMIEEIKRVNL